MEYKNKKIIFQNKELYVVKYGNQYLFLNETDFYQFQQNEDSITKNSDGRFFYLVNKETLQNIEKYGINTFMANIAQINYNLSSKNLIENLDNKEYILIEVKNNPNGIRYFEDSNKNLYFEPIIISYIESQLDDINFKLDDFLEELTKRADVSFLCESRQNSFILDAPVQDTNPNIGKIIFDIEHHLEDNEQEPKEKESFTLIYYPSQEAKEFIKNYNNYQDLTEYSKEYKIYSMERKILFEFLNAEKYYIKPESEIKVIRKFKNY